MAQTVINPFDFPQQAQSPVTGSEFSQTVMDYGSDRRDEAVYNEIAAGNFPSFLRRVIHLVTVQEDAEGNRHEVTISVLPDVMAIGTDSDFVRIPMLPLTAQKTADLFGAVLPTSKISDIISRLSAVKLDPHPMTPDNTMTTMPVFVRHDSIIEASRRATGIELGRPVTGHKKDIVITNRLADEPGRLFIYGWHHPDGRPIQQISGVHKDYYVDYSHGVRLVSDRILIDGKPCSLKQTLAHPVLYRILSYEDGPMKVTEYRPAL